MAGQEQQRQRAARRRAGRRRGAARRARGAQGQGRRLDAILDEIDDVLESNAEEFVKGFVQKGGQ